MKLKSVPQLNDFIYAVNQCKGQVWLESPEGDKYNLKSVFSQYIALGKLLEERGDYLELFCQNVEDEKYFYDYFEKHPEVQSS